MLWSTQVIPNPTTIFLLQLSRLLNEADKKGDLPLLLALKTKQKTVASSLVEHGACVDARDPEGLTLLLSAVEKGTNYILLISSPLFILILRLNKIIRLKKLFKMIFLTDTGLLFRMP